MNKKITILLLLTILVLSGCVPQIPFGKDKVEVEEAAAKAEELLKNVCIDNNGNGVCDKNEVPAKVQTIKEPVKVTTTLPSEYTEVIGNQDRIESYSYARKTYEGGLGSVSIKDKYEILFKDDKMQQLFDGKICYYNDNNLYEYMEYDNESHVRSNSLVKENTLLAELDGVSNLVIEKEKFSYESKESMVVNYEKDGNSYRTTIWKYYGVPVLVEINNEEDTGDIIRYEVKINKVNDEDVTLPNSLIIE
ncbi:MAG: hypothetical protein KAQ83_01600 [Nanoarchaeota archaeon]|nr:hypothetical protein [Nanoarchaeota archaeon]